jgi:hypothetical protein
MILAYLAAGPEHGYALAERLTVDEWMPARSSGRISVSGGDGTPGADQARGNRVRQRTGQAFVPLTPAGKVCLGKWIDTLGGYQRGIGRLVAMLREANSAIQA